MATTTDTKKKATQTGTTGTTGKTMDQYYSDVYGKSVSAVNEQYTDRQATDEQTKAKISAAIDQATQASTGQYQTQIDNAPAESRVQYDQNAMDNMVAQKQIQQRLANMGLTDSGLNSSMQTALAVQKNRADATVRSEEQAKIQAAQDAINQIVASGESQKAEQYITIDQNTQDWYNDVMAQLPTTAYGLAQSSYQFDKGLEENEINRQWQTNENEASRQWQTNENEASRQWQTNENEASRQWQSNENEADRQWQSNENATSRSYSASASTSTASRWDIINQLMESGATQQEALAYSYQIMPSEDATTNLYYEAISNGYSDKESQIYAAAGGGTAGEDAVQDSATATAASFVNGLNLKVTGWSTFWGNQDADGEKVATQVKTLLKSNQQFEGMSNAEQSATLAATVGRMVAINWSKSGDATDNDTRLKVACNQLGADYSAAKAYYDMYYQGN